MPTAKKLPSGSWRCRVYIGKSKEGKPVYRSFTASTKKQAEMDAMLCSRESKQPESELTLGAAIDRYIESKSSILSPSTIRSYGTIRRTAFQSVIDIPLIKLNKEKQQVAINIYSESHSPKSVRNASGLLYSTMQMYCRENAYSLSLPQAKKQRITIPQSDQVGRLIHYFKGKPMYLVVLLASSLGLRRSEISAIKRDDFNFEKSTLHIRRAMVQADGYIWVVKSTKTTESDRILQVPPFIMNLVKSAPDRGEYLIGMSPDAITHAFRKGILRLGISCRFHDLRHYYASILLAIGVPDQYAMKRMGHATTNMLKNVYQHVMEDKDKEVDELIALQMSKLY